MAAGARCRGQWGGGVEEKMRIKGAMEEIGRIGCDRSEWGGLFRSLPAPPPFAIGPARFNKQAMGAGGIKQLTGGQRLPWLRCGQWTERGQKHRRLVDHLKGWVKNQPP